MQKFAFSSENGIFNTKFLTKKKLNSSKNVTFFKVIFEEKSNF